jgi:hypothetical protein
MVVLDGNFALGCGPGTDYRQIYIYIFQFVLKGIDTTTNEILEQITFVLAYPTIAVCLILVLSNSRVEMK